MKNSNQCPSQAECILRRATNVVTSLLAVLGFAVLMAQSAQAHPFSVAYTFKGGTDGATPESGLVLGAGGDLYGTTNKGGAYGAGTVYKLIPSGAETVVYTFTGGSDGKYPYGPLVPDSANNLYGTTVVGGTYGFGTVFKLDSTGKETVLYSFLGGSNGQYPWAGLAFDSAGNLYGTTLGGGTSDYGTVFKLDATGHQTVLHSFTGTGGDGEYPYAGMVLDASTNLYGTTNQGGNSGSGVVFKVTPSGSESVLYSFTGGADGGSPMFGVLVFDTAGNLYGTTSDGGVHGDGTVFKLATNGQEAVLYSFCSVAGCKDGVIPWAGLVMDEVGNLYGTTTQGGTANGGTIFELDPTGNETVLYNFTGKSDGSWPQAAFFRGALGNLWGVAGGGSTGDGVVFTLTFYKILHSFSNNGKDGIQPDGAVIFDTVGNLYGTTYNGGDKYYGGGTVFKVTPGAHGNWSEKVLYSFSDGKDGGGPYPTLVFDSAGNSYGTTVAGGIYNNKGTAFELTPHPDGKWTEKVLHSFGKGKDGTNPVVGVIVDSAGNLYGTTSMGGVYDGGIVFELTPGANGKWTEKVLHNFGEGKDGSWPYSLIFDASGNLYGTTANGGANDNNGIVFELINSGGGNWTEKILYNFCAVTYCLDGAWPTNGLVFDSLGNLYGMTHTGGDEGYCYGYGCGTVFELTPGANGVWTEGVLFAFYGFNGGMWPYGGVIFDSAGNLYGTTFEGGAGQCKNGNVTGCGSVFEVTPSPSGNWSARVLHTFMPNGTDGYYGGTGLLMDSAGNLYGTNPLGGAHDQGTVFEYLP